MNRTLRMVASPVAGLLLLTLCATATAGESPSKLRTEMGKAEKQFFDLYNKLNTEADFKIICRMEKPTGTNFATRVCQAKYLMDAAQASAGERMRDAVKATQSSGTENGAGSNAGVSMGGGAPADQPDKDTAFRLNMVKVLQQSPELKELGRKRDELQKRYEDATR